jgi:hypothetical protein
VKDLASYANCYDPIRSPNGCGRHYKAGSQVGEEPCAGRDRVLSCLQRSRLYFMDRRHLKLISRLVPDGTFIGLPIVLNRPLPSHDHGPRRGFAMRNSPRQRRVYPIRSKRSDFAMAWPFIEERCWPLCRPTRRTMPKMNSLSSVDGTNRVFGREREFSNSIVCYG